MYCTHAYSFDLIHIRLDGVIASNKFSKEFSPNSNDTPYPVQKSILVNQCTTYRKTTSASLQTQQLSCKSWQMWTSVQSSPEFQCIPPSRLYPLQSTLTFSIAFTCASCKNISHQQREPSFVSHNRNISRFSVNWPEDLHSALSMVRVVAALPPTLPSSWLGWRTTQAMQTWNRENDCQSGPVKHVLLW